MVEVRFRDEHLRLTWEDWEQRVRDGRIPPDALIRFEPVTGPDWRPAHTLGMFAAAASGADAFARIAARDTPPWATAILVGVQIRIWWLARLPGPRAVFEDDLTKWTPPVLEQGEVWRMLSMGLVHTGLAHLLMNTLWMAYTAYHLERALGARALTVLFGAGVLGGSALSLFASPDAPSLGASGGIFGLVAACVVFGFVRPEILPERMRRTFGFALLPYLFLMLLSGATSEGTDNWSHLGGTLTGALLALFSDPPGMDRRPGWNVRWQSGVVVVGTLFLAVLAVAGPRLVPLRTADEALRATTTGRVILRDEPVDHRVPAGWRRAATADGSLGWSAPRAPRTFAVVYRPRSRPEDPQAILDGLVARARDAATAAVDRPVDPTVPVPMADLSPVAARLDLTLGDVPVEWTAWVARRGTASAVVVWQVESARAARLAPLRDRLLRRVAWPAPSDLAELRARYASFPDAAPVARALSDRLAEVGEVAEALAMRRALVRGDGPPSPRDAVRLLQTWSWYPDAAPDLRETLDDLLARVPEPVVIAEGARALDAADATDLARGLLDLGWRAWPGESALATARASAGLPTGLDARGVPWADRWDVVTDQPVEPPAPAVVSLAEAARAAAERDAEESAARVRLEDAVADRDGDAAVRALVLLDRGYPIDDPVAEALVAAQTARDRDLDDAARDLIDATLSARREATDSPR